MIKILFFIDKFAYNGSIGGAEKVLITLVNHMDPEKFDITVQTLFPDEYSSLLNSNIKYKYCYSKKTSLAYKLFRVEAQLGLVYALHIKDDYDIEVAYLESEATKVMASSTNKKAKKIAWIHCDFDIAVSDKKAFYQKTAKRGKNRLAVIKSVSEVLSLDFLHRIFILAVVQLVRPCTIWFQIMKARAYPVAYYIIAFQPYLDTIHDDNLPWMYRLTLDVLLTNFFFTYLYYF